MIKRQLTTIARHPLKPGFMGTGHTAAAVISGNFQQTDPFIALMDDSLDLPGTEVAGGAHPHAGFETVTLVLSSDNKVFKEGNFEMMTAGKGVIHTEEITQKTAARFLQLWLTLPKDKRWAHPFLQEIDLANVPALKDSEKEIKVYSGSSQGLTSPIKNNTPVTIVDFRLQKNITAKQIIPASYNGFIYVIEGSVTVGDKTVDKGASAWLSRPEDKGDSEIVFNAGANGAWFILYAGEPSNAPIISHGPFIADTKEDIVRLFTEYHRGEMKHITTLSDEYVAKFISE